MKVTPTNAFLRDLKHIDKPKQSSAIKALELFMANPKARALNFEPVRSRAGYHTIRADYSVRILLRETAKFEFDAVAIGNHDYIYVSYFR